MKEWYAPCEKAKESNVPQPMAICIEDMKASSDSTRYLQCVALVGDHAGLRIDPSGEIQWQPERDARLVELCVSYDERLLLYRQLDAAPVLLLREGRSLEVPVEKPVVVLDQDQLSIGDRELRIHIHGEAPAVAPPSWLPMEEPSRSTSNLLRATATALALGIAVGAGGCTKKIEVRDDPPKIAPPPTKPDTRPPPKPDTQPPPKADVGPSKPDASPLKPGATKAPPIEVRPRPPRVAPPRKPPPKPDKPK